MTLSKRPSLDSLFSAGSSSLETFDQGPSPSIATIDSQLGLPVAPNDPSPCPSTSSNAGLHDQKPARYIDPAQSSVVQVCEVPGLYYLPQLIDEEAERQMLKLVAESNLFCGGTKNQMMFFSNPILTPMKDDDVFPTCRSFTHSFLNWPTFLVELIDQLPTLIQAANPGNLDQLNDAVFDPHKAHLPWQIIINLYRPLEGITRHVDLLDRFDDVIIGISLGSSAVMDFERDVDGIVERVYLEHGSGYILSRASRFSWKHGISANQSYDILVDSSNGTERMVQRCRSRVSITIRRLREGGELVGHAEH
ncbi:hypothetical protein CROQUDRAFT_661780 [Cronartium quercuum f. sp. fusiforme G11]|uniref:Fe2OG dioxygenase domain-containing protein n=1 Tax=Cronartium quercuum f. sp. fusiforme G11 TaxID=708437 RepID=A0A9P6T9X7_9BASI|nr:hypothetical protein CROQUDRAFT_661780 [Cronartium quercuum f. sp. fusiforme G11]